MSLIAGGIIGLVAVLHIYFRVSGLSCGSALGSSSPDSVLLPLWERATVAHARHRRTDTEGVLAKIPPSRRTAQILVRRRPSGGLENAWRH